MGFRPIKARAGGGRGTLISNFGWSKGRLRTGYEALSAQGLQNTNSVPCWIVWVQYIKAYHVHHSTATYSRWRGHSQVINLKQNPHSQTHSNSLPIGKAQHLSRNKHTVTHAVIFYVITPEVRHRAPRVQVQGYHLVLGLQTVQAPNVQWIERNTTCISAQATVLVQ